MTRNFPDRTRHFWQSSRMRHTLAPVLSVLAVVAVLLGPLAVTPALAASFQQVNSSDWSVPGLPSYVTMYIYVPDKLATKPPIVVAPHHCQGTGSSTYSEMSSLVTIANTTGFIMIFPEATGENCWDAGSSRSLKHDGGGDTQAIAQMVRYTLSKYSGDASRVYTVGQSSGGIMTEALLGVYPDVFLAGISIMGVPCGCWADSYHDVVGKPADGTGQWSGPCANGTVTKTGQEWADLVRSYFPGYDGHRPRVQHWHGTADPTIAYTNMAESTKEWTTLLGLSATPTGNDTPKSGTTRQFWKNSCGYTVFETFSLAGVGHAVPFDGNAVAAYFGLDKSGPDPEIAACPHDGGVSTSDSGAGGKDGSADAVPSSTGGISGSGGNGGSGGAAGATGAGGISGNGGTVGAGGSLSSGGSTGAGGSRVASSGGSQSPGGSGGSSAQGGNVGSGGSSEASTVQSGCSCALGRHQERGQTTAAIGFIAVLALARRRRKR